MKPESHEAATTDDCTGCPLHGALEAPAVIERRDFLRAAGLAMASLGMLGLGARDASAMPIRSIAALPARGAGNTAEKR